MVFTSLDFTTLIFSQIKVMRFVANPPTRRTRSLYICPPVTGWPSYTPRHWVPFLSPLWLTGQWWRYSSSSPHGVQYAVFHWCRILSPHIWANSLKYCFLPSLPPSIPRHYSSGWALASWTIKFLWYEVVSLTPNPQPGGPGCPSLSAFYPLTCPAWVTLPVATLLLA
jgi:hypothetical protein